MSSPELFTFAVYPADFGDGFESFLLEVPTLSGLAVAARRAWWSAFHILGPRGVEPEEFSVCVWKDGAPGSLVTSGGLA
jgi:hypothetical protein